MSSQPSPHDIDVDPVDEQLVAYLDGELSTAERQDLERKLLSDASLRVRMRELQSGWQMLEDLPQATVKDNFTQSTLEMVAADIQSEAKAVRPLPRWGRLIAILLATVAAGAVGAALVLITRGVERQRQFADLPIAEHLDAYLVTDDLEWLQEISQDPTWLDTIESAEKVGAFGPTGLPTSTPELQDLSPSELAEKLPLLHPTVRRRIDTGWQRFQNLSPDKQAEVRQRAQEIAATENPEELLRTIEAYARLKRNWSDETAATIQSGNPEDRELAFRKSLAKSRQLWLRQLSESDSDAIFDALHLIASGWLENLENSDQLWKEYARDYIDRTSGPDQDDRFPDEETALLHWLFVIGRGRFAPFSIAEEDAIKAVLSDPVREALVRETLDKLPSSGDMEEDLVRGWLVEAVQRKTRTNYAQTLAGLEPRVQLEIELSPPELIFPVLERKSREGRMRDSFSRPSRPPSSNSKFPQAPPPRPGPRN